MTIDTEFIRSVMFGHAVADALGVPVEFVSRRELRRDPVTDMRGYGTYRLPAGCWSDDTSMSLCTLDALADGYCDLDEVMAGFGRWYFKGEFTPTGEMFDVGNCCSRAIERYTVEKIPANKCGSASDNSNGNGSLMRIHPIVMYLLSRDQAITEEGMDLIFSASAITHAHPRAKLGCGIYALIFEKIAECRSKDSIYAGLVEGANRFADHPEISHYSRLADPEFSLLPESEIKSGGYVVDTLEAAIWCLLSTESYRDCVLRAVNLGDDTDTVAAVAGGLAGLMYGYDAIPKEWTAKLKKRDYIDEMCQRAALAWTSSTPDIGVTDLHMHLVYEVDDGARDRDMALDMLRSSYSQGIRRIFCSSHSSADREIYDRNFKNLKAVAATEFPDLRLYPSCEIFCSDEHIPSIIDALDSGRLRTIGGTKYVLIEFAMQETKEYVADSSLALLDRGYIPVIAHVERCEPFDDLEFAAALSARGVMLQINCYSLVEESNLNIKKRARSILSHRLASFVGSDAHRTDHRPPNVIEGIRYVWFASDRKYAKLLLEGRGLEL